MKIWLTWARCFARVAGGVVIVLVCAAWAPAAAPPITALAFAPDGSSLVVGSQAGLEVRSFPELQHTSRLDTGLVNIHAVAFSPHGKILAVAGGTPADSGIVELWRWPECDLLQRLRPHDDLIHGLSWRSDSQELATAGADRKIGILPVDVGGNSGPAARFLEGHSRGVLAVVYLPREYGLLTAGIDETLRLWDVERARTQRTLSNHTRPVHALAARPMNNSSAPPLVASVSDDRTVRLWQPTIGRLVRFARLESEPLCVAWSRDGSLLFVACKDGHLRTLDPDTVEVLRGQAAISGVAHVLAVAPDGSVVVGGQNGELRRLISAGGWG